MSLTGWVCPSYIKHRSSAGQDGLAGLLKCKEKGLTRGVYKLDTKWVRRAHKGGPRCKKWNLNSLLQICHASEREYRGRCGIMYEWGTQVHKGG